jgi:hypothetical protein
MGKIKKHHLFIVFLCFLLGVIVAGLIIYFLPLFKKPVITQTVNVFGAPRSQAQQNFPVSNPQFTAVIGNIKPASLHQQSISVYQLKDVKKIPVFERSFYSDGFRGNGLTYTLSSSLAEITQSGSLGSIGCATQNCILPWRNFYTWNNNQHTFVLDNASHKSDFQQLLSIYQSLDQKGCNLMKGTIIAGQDGLSFTEIYKKYPTENYYCSQSQGILPANFVFFLQTEKTLNEIVKGENIGSEDIRDTTL